MRNSAQDIAVWILIIALGSSVFLLRGYIILGIPGLVILILSILMVCSDPQPILGRAIAYSVAAWSLLYICCVIAMRFSFDRQVGNFDVIFVWLLLNAVSMPLAILTVIIWAVYIVDYRGSRPDLSEPSGLR